MCVRDRWGRARVCRLPVCVFCQPIRSPRRKARNIGRSTIARAARAEGRARGAFAAVVARAVGSRAAQHIRHKPAHALPDIQHDQTITQPFDLFYPPDDDDGEENERTFSFSLSTGALTSNRASLLLLLPLFLRSKQTRARAQREQPNRSKGRVHDTQSPLALVLPGQFDRCGLGLAREAKRERARVQTPGERQLSLQTFVERAGACMPPPAA